MNVKLLAVQVWPECNRTRRFWNVNSWTRAFKYHIQWL